MISFTPEERRIILFLLSAALLGSGLNFSAKRFAAVKTIVCPSQNLGKININQASEEDLLIVPGIGKKLAQRIIAYRNQNARFNSVEELNNIKGFKMIGSFVP